MAKYTVRKSGRLPSRLKKPMLGLLVASVALSAYWVLSVGDQVPRVNAVYAEAQAAHPGDTIESLTAYLASEDHPVAKRGYAVWILGELRDERALPVLRERVDAHQGLQKELETAIHKITGEKPEPPRFWKLLRNRVVPCTQGV